MSFRGRMTNRVIRRFIGRREPSLREIRRHLEFVARFFPPPSPTLRLRLVKAGSVPCLWVQPRRRSFAGVILYLHGGGYCFGSPRTHRMVICKLARLTGFAILAPDYRLAPEHPFPAAFEDAMVCWRWLLEMHRDKHLFVGGDSAGGGLSLALTLRLKQEGDVLPKALFAWSPWTDLAITGDSVKTNASSEAYVLEETLRVMSANYLAGQDSKNPLVSPLYGDLSGFPPVLLQASGSETLLDDTRRLGGPLGDTPVTMNIYAGLPHVWQLLYHILPEGRKALGETAAFLQGACG